MASHSTTSTQNSATARSEETRAGRSAVALATSGLGHAFGGIGVVSRMVVDALEPQHRVTIWRHHHDWPTGPRIAGFGVRALLGSWHKPRFIVYEHWQLAKIHTLIPSLRTIPYGLFLYGIDAWSPIGGRGRAAIEGAQLRLAISETTVQLTREQNPWLPETHIVWLGISPQFLQDRPSTGRSPTALVVGRMAAEERYKGHDQILDGWSAVVEAVPDARLVVVGGGDDRPRLRQRVQDERLVNVEFPGKVSDDELRALYQTSRVLMFPSRREGFGLVAVEAAAGGLPVLGLKGTVMEELFPNGEGAALADEQSGPAIAAAVIPLLRDAALADTLGQRAQTRVREHFLEEHFANRFRDAVSPFLED